MGSLRVFVGAGYQIRLWWRWVWPRGVPRVIFFYY